MLSILKNKNFRYSLIYLGVTIFALLTCAIYYIYSHGEKDGHITFLFLPSLISTALFIILFLTGIRFDNYTYYLFNAAFVFYYMYNLLMGIYLIAYVESGWTFVFYIVAIFFAVLMVINEVVARLKTRTRV